MRTKKRDRLRSKQWTSSLGSLLTKCISSRERPKTLVPGQHLDFDTVQKVPTVLTDVGMFEYQVTTNNKKQKKPLNTIIVIADLVNACIVSREQGP